MAERRLAAIMFTDIVGYTALMAESEEKGLRVRRRHRQVLRPLVERYHGEWVQDVGDETLSSFPSAGDAVNCALAIQATLRGDPELKVRTGIHLGDVVLEEGSLHGDGINVASRIRPLAEAGGICVSGEVYKSIRNQPRIEAVSLGERELKNVPEPVAVYSISGKADPPWTVSWTVPALRTARRWPIQAVAILLVIALGVGWWIIRPSAELPPIRSIAVLPLKNLSGDAEQEYFADGMTEALIAELGKVGALHVTSRTSSMRYKRTDKSVPEIARELGVNAVVEGSILRAGERVRVTAQLIHASADRHLWAQSYERKLHDVLALQGEVARAIAQQVEIKLTPGQRLRLSSTRTVDPAAYEAHLRGRFFLNQHNLEAYRSAIQHFETAIERDADYAPAHSGLAEAYVRLPEYMAMRPREAMPLAKAAATRALALDDSLAEVHTALGAVLSGFDRDWAGAERAFERAIELNPSSSAARLWYAKLLDVTGRVEEALAERERALELDPLSLLAHTDLAISHVRARRYERALEQLRAALELDRDFVFANLWVGLIYSYQSMHEQAVAQLQRTAELAGQERALWPELGYAYARAGRTEEARALAERALELSRSRYIIPTLVAEVFAALGEHEKVFELLERAYRERDRSIVGITWRPAFDSVRSDPRYTDLIRRMGLPES